MRAFYQILPMVLLFVGFSTTVVAEVVNPALPSYQQALDKFKAEQSTKKGPGLSEADKNVMQKSTQQLARSMPDPGLKVGEKAPDFSLPDAFGKQLRLYELLNSGPVVLTFYRGSWCPYCNLELRALHQSLPQFKAYGAQLLAVTPQLPDKSLEQVKKDGYPFPIVSDLDSSVSRDYRLWFEVPTELSEVYQRNFELDLAAYNGAGRYELPVPGTFVIDRDAVVRAAYSDVDYTKRMEPAEILKALKEL